MKKTITLLLAAALVLAFVLPVLSQDDEITLGTEDGGFAAPQRPAVVFSHINHEEYDGVDGCLPCHHSAKNDDGTFAEADDYLKCTECHGPSDGSGLDELPGVFHKNCIGCHEAQAKGPVACGECHVQTDFYGVPLGGAEEAAEEAAEGEAAQ